MVSQKIRRIKTTLNYFQKMLHFYWHSPSGNLTTVLVLQIVSEVFVLKSTDVEFPSSDSLQDVEVFLSKEIEAFIVASVFFNALANFLKSFDPGTFVRKG